LEGDSSCYTTVDWSVTNPISGADTAVTSNWPENNTTIGTGVSGSNPSVEIPYNSRTFFLYHNGGAPLDSKTAYANCTDGTGWDGDSCEVGVEIINGVCDNSTVNSCYSGYFVDLEDSSSSFIWMCQSPNGGSNQICSMPSGGGIGGEAFLSFSAYPKYILKGKSSTLRWSVTDSGYTCTSSQFDTGSNSSGEARVTPEETTTYNISCTKAESPGLTASTTVKVINPIIIEN